MTDRELIQKLIGLRERANQRRSRLRASQLRPQRLGPAPLSPEPRPTPRDGRGVEGERVAAVTPPESLGEASIAAAAGALGSLAA